MLDSKFKDMKKNIKYFMVALLTIFSLSGCSDYFDLSENPNQITDPPLKGLLSTATSKTALNSYRAGSVTSSYVQYLASPSAGSSFDTYDDVDLTGTWDAVYFAMADINEMKKKAVASGASEYTGVADVMLAYHLAIITDFFGQGPFKQAFNSTNLNPVYDSEEDLYKSTGDLLNEAITELNKTNSSFKLDVGNDLIFGGDKNKWIKFAYMLKARLLNKISKKSSYNPNQVLAAVDNAFKSNSDNAAMSAFSNRNPWNQVAVNNAALVLGGWLSNQLVDAINGTTFGVVDPRISKIASKTITNTYKGTPNGVGNVGSAANTVKDESYISLTGALSSDNSPIYIATYSELKFIEAEAAFRSSQPTRAYAAYLEGIKASMDQFGVSTTDKDAYLTSSGVAKTALTLTLADIFKEKYVATYLNPEAWNDARRYDYKYKNFTIPINAVLTTYIRRVGYVSGEQSKNGVNVPASVALSTNLYWDKP